MVITGHAHHAASVMRSKFTVSRLAILREAVLHAEAVAVLVAERRSLRPIGKRIVDKLVHKADHHRMIDQAYTRPAERGTVPLWNRVPVGVKPFDVLPHRLHLFR